MKIVYNFNISNHEREDGCDHHGDDEQPAPPLKRTVPARRCADKGGESKRQDGDANSADVFHGDMSCEFSERGINVVGKVFVAEKCQ